MSAASLSGAVRSCPRRKPAVNSESRRSLRTNESSLVVLERGVTTEAQRAHPSLFPWYLLLLTAKRGLKPINSKADRARDAFDGGSLVLTLSTSQEKRFESLECTLVFKIMSASMGTKPKPTICEIHRQLITCVSDDSCRGRRSVGASQGLVELFDYFSAATAARVRRAVRSG